MGLDYGLDDNPGSRRKNRWLFSIKNVSADDSAAVSTYTLPPKRGARPSLSWKEYECQHLTETIYYPFKPDWKPISLTLYDIRCNKNPVFDWIRLTQNISGNGGGLYDPQQGIWTPIVPSQMKREGNIQLLDGCGNIVECWTLDNCYPSSVEWGELDMDSSEIITVEVQVRYDRAYIAGGSGGGSSGDPPPFNVNFGGTSSSPPSSPGLINGDPFEPTNLAG